MSHDHHHHRHEQDHLVDDQGELLPTSSQRYKDTVRVTLVGSAVDLLLGVAKIFFGFIANSQALVADGVHSLSDLVTDVAVLYAAKHSHREADEDHPYGHGRIETVVTVGLGIALIGVAVGIAFDAIHRLLDPSSLLVPGMGALIIALLSVAAKEAIYHYTMVVARRYRSKMLKANAWHSRSDAISSIIVVIGIAGSMLGITYLDAVAAIGVGLMIAKIGWDLSWHSLQELIDSSLHPERVDEIKNAILDVDGVVTLHILRTRHMGSDALVDVHIQVNPHISVSEAHYISETVRSMLIKKFDEVSDVMVHIDPEDDEHMQQVARLPLRREILHKLEPALDNLEEAKQIQDITLHYLDGKIQIELLLPLTILHNAPPERAEQIRTRFKDAVTNVEEVSDLMVRFQ